MPKTKMPEMLLFVTPKKLSDGSEVFDVFVGNERFEAITGDDAIELADKIRAAIEDHTNTTVDIIYEWGNTMTKDTEDRLAHAKEQGQAQFDSIKEMVEALQNAQNLLGDDDTDDASQRIQEDALSVEVRSGWCSPGELGAAEEYTILLCTGGPAVRIIGSLNECCEPESARMEVQDWFQPWTEFRPVVGPLMVTRTGKPSATEMDYDSEPILLAYARCFYMGE
jgi:hypothetical protein